MKIIISKDKKVLKISQKEWQNLGKEMKWFKTAQLLSYFDEISLGPKPTAEFCVQIGADNYVELSKMELRAYRNQLHRTFPNIPQGVYFKTQINSHDFETYYVMAVKFPEDDEVAVNFAYEVENNTPENWDEQAKKELQEQGYFDLLQTAKSDALIKEAKWGKEVEITNPGKWDGYTLKELRKKRDAAKKRQNKREKADPKDTSLLRELNFAIRAKTGWGKAK